MSVRKLLGSLIVLCSLHACDFGSVLRGGGGTGGEGLTLTGRLVDPSGTPVAGAKVALYPEAEAETALPLSKAAADAVAASGPDSTFTDAAGRYRFRKVPAGRYNLAATFARNDTTYAMFLGDIHLEKSLDMKVDTLHRGVELQVWVRDEADRPVAGARCAITGSPWSTVADAAGVCFLREVAAGTHAVSVAGPGLPPVVGEVHVAPDRGAVVDWTLASPEPAWITLGTPQGYSYRIPANLALVAASGDEPEDPDSWHAWYRSPSVALRVGLAMAMPEVRPDTFPGYAQAIAWEDASVRAERISYRRASAPGSRDTVYEEALILRDRSSGSARLNFVAQADDPGRRAIAALILASVRKSDGTAPVLIPPLVPVPTLPRHDSAGVSLNPTLAWEPGNDPAFYHLEVSSDSLFATLVFEDSLVTGTSRAIGPLEPYTAYYWRLRARKGPFVSDPSETRRFTTVGLGWVNRSVAATDTFMGVAYSGTSYALITAPYRFLLSTTGDTWTTVVPADVPTLMETDIAWFGNLFAATDNLGMLRLMQADGSYWNTTYQIGSPSKPLHSLYADGSTLLVGGTGEVHIVSADYSSRVAQPLESGAGVRGLTRRNGYYVAVLDDGTLFTSPDTPGSTVWTKRSSGTTKALHGVASGAKGVVVAVGEDGVILRSEDGITWGPVSSGTQSHLYDVYFHDGVYIAAGAAGTILYSRDGKDWVAHQAPLSSQDFRFVRRAGSRWYVGGANGALFTFQ